MPKEKQVKGRTTYHGDVAFEAATQVYIQFLSHLYGPTFNADAAAKAGVSLFGNPSQDPKLVRNERPFLVTQMGEVREALFRGAHVPDGIDQFSPSPLQRDIFSGPTMRDARRAIKERAGAKAA